MKKPVAVALIITGVALLSICGFVSLVLIWAAATKTLPISESDTQVIVTANDLVPYFDDYAPTIEHESFQKVQYLDQSVELTYEYDSPNENDPFVSTTISYERNKGDASGVYLATWTFQKLGLKSEDQKFELEELDSFYSIGDRSRFANIMYGGEPVGHLFLVQKGNTVYSFILTGFLIEDPSVWMELFSERIQNL
jgi:hypothetical protein